ncbi:MAG: Branched-chain amino acid ABC transporter permease [Candidatus Rokubacteria bacterium]|nr:Branched-chain amino acid ABC transporter permease [Candidatus Rokubacteria bacterium]
MTFLADLAQTLINGILQGGVYAAAAVGLSLIFGVSGILNAAHGELIMLGAFATYWLVTLYHVDALLTLPISFVLLGALGYALQYFVLNRTLGRPLLLSLLVTFGISLILVNVALRLWSADHRMLRIPYFEHSLLVGPFVIPLSRVVACLVGVGMVAGLSWLLASTRLGRMIRATAQDWEMARLVGVNPRRVYAVTFGLGAGVSGVAGSLVAFYTPVEPYMGLTYTLFAFAVVVLGGLGYTAGVVWGGLALGVAQALTETYLEAGLSLLVAFFLLYLVLRFMPAGIIGKGRLE